MKSISRQFVRYAIIGAFGTALDFALLWMFLRIRSPIALAVTAAYALATLAQFFLNRSWTFQAYERPAAYQLPVYILVTFVNWLVALVFVEVGTRTFDLSPMIAKALSIPPSALVGFLGNRHLTFRRRPNA